MRKYLATLYWNKILRNKIATECWNILKYEIESIIDHFVPFEKTRKMVYKETHVRKHKDYANYKEALNAAMSKN